MRGGVCLRRRGSQVMVLGPASSRCKNSVGLNAVGAEGSASAYGIFSRDWCVVGGCGEQVEASGRRLRRHCGVREGGARPTAFVSRSRAWRLDAPGQVCSWRARGMQGRLGVCLRRRGSQVMVLGPASGKAGGQTGEDPRRSKRRRALRPAFPGRRTDRRGLRSSCLEAASPDGRAEAADGRGRRVRAWRDATGRSSGPCAGPWAGHAGGSGA